MRDKKKLLSRKGIDQADEVKGGNNEVNNKF